MIGYCKYQISNFVVFLFPTSKLTVIKRTIPEVKGVGWIIMFYQQSNDTLVYENVADSSFTRIELPIYTVKNCLFESHTVTGCNCLLCTSDCSKRWIVSVGASSHSSMRKRNGKEGAPFIAETLNVLLFKKCLPPGCESSGADATLHSQHRISGPED